MTNEERIIALEKEVATLKERVTEIFDALVVEGNSTTEHFAKFDNLLAEVIDCVMPAVHKVFPGIARDQREIAAFLKRRPPSSSTKKRD